MFSPYFEMAGTWCQMPAIEKYQSFCRIVRICPRRPEPRYASSDRAFGLIGISPPRGSHRGAPFGNASINMFSACHRLRCGCAAPLESSSAMDPAYMLVHRTAQVACRFPDSRGNVKDTQNYSLFKVQFPFLVTETGSGD